MQQALALVLYGMLCVLGLWSAVLIWKWVVACRELKALRHFTARAALELKGMAEGQGTSRLDTDYCGRQVHRLDSTLSAAEDLCTARSNDAWPVVLWALALWFALLTGGIKWPL